MFCHDLTVRGYCFNVHAFASFMLLAGFVHSAVVNSRLAIGTRPYPLYHAVLWVHLNSFPFLILNYYNIFLRVPKIQARVVVTVCYKAAYRASINPVR